MPDTAVRSLLRLEARRGRMVLVKVLPAVAVISAIFVLVEGGRPSGWAMGLGILGFGQGMFPGIRALPDKLDGTLEFITSLPVDGRRLAWAHVLACAAYALFGSACWTGALVVGLPLPPGTAWSPAAVLGALVSLWIAGTAVSALTSGAFIRLDLETAGWAPAALLAGLLGTSVLIERIWPGLDAAVLDWLLTSASPTLITGLVVGLGGAGTVAAYLLLRDGLTNFRPHQGGLPPA